MLGLSRDEKGVPVHHALIGLTGEKHAFMTTQFRLWFLRRLVDNYDGIAGETLMQQVSSQGSAGRLRLREHYWALRYANVLEGGPDPEGEIRIAPRFARAIGSLIARLDILQGRSKANISDGMAHYAGLAVDIMGEPDQLAELFAKTQRYSSQALGRVQGKAATAELIASIIRGIGRPATLLDILDRLNVGGRRSGLPNLRQYVSEMYQQGKVTAFDPKKGRRARHIGKATLIAPPVLLNRFDMQDLALEYGFDLRVGFRAHRLCIAAAAQEKDSALIAQRAENPALAHYGAPVTTDNLIPLLRRWLQDGYDNTPALPYPYAGKTTLHFLAEMLNALYPQLSPRLPLPEDVMAAAPQYFGAVEWMMLGGEGTLWVTHRSVRQYLEAGENLTRSQTRYVVPFFSRLALSTALEDGASLPATNTSDLPLRVSDTMVYVGQEPVQTWNTLRQVYGFEPTFFVRRWEAVVQSQAEARRLGVHAGLKKMLAPYVEQVRLQLENDGEQQGRAQ